MPTPAKQPLFPVRLPDHILGREARCSGIKLLKETPKAYQIEVPEFNGAPATRGWLPKSQVRILMRYRDEFADIIIPRWLYDRNCPPAASGRRVETFRDGGEMNARR